MPYSPPKKRARQEEDYVLSSDSDIEFIQEIQGGDGKKLNFIIFEKLEFEKKIFFQNYFFSI